MMQKRINNVCASLLVVLIAACSGTSHVASEQHRTYTPESKALYDTIAYMDSVLFDAFNKRKTEKFRNMFTKDLEFYHDEGGLTGYQHTVDFMESTAANKNNDLRRELVEGSLEVYPVKDYGAIQVGRHRFCHTENGKQDCGTFKFVHIWKKIDNEWKISRVVSYDH